MHTEFDGQAIALERIAAEARDRTGFLDLSQLGLTELPEALSALTALQSLDCSRTQVSDLGPLTALQSLYCNGTQVSDLGPLAALTALKSLDCGVTQVSDLGPLAALTALQSLYFWETQVSDLGPLVALTALQWLNCSYTQVSDLGPLAPLTALQWLNCSDTRVSDLGLLAALTGLQSLNCDGTQVSDLAPLASLTELQSLSCSWCPPLLVPEPIWYLPALDKMIICETTVSGIPPEELSQTYDENCLPAVRAYLRDREEASVQSTDIKLLVLGNGRAGKIQLTRFLNNQPFDTTWNSTHGISIVNTSLPGIRGESDTNLHIWDFGGQDIYHGTHALFVRSRAIFVLIWAKNTEPPPDTYDHLGLTFRNHPLQYWATYAAHLRAEHSPILVVQSKCDTDADEAPEFPLPPETRKALGRIREVRFSAASPYRGHEELTATIRGAIAELREKQGTFETGVGRLRVQRRLEALRNPDGSMPPEWRLMDQETFRNWCTEARNISSPEMFLRSLHNSGVVFYEPGLFGDNIVLDHAWAINAIYAVFDRKTCYIRLRKDHGRFDRAILEALVWQNFTPDEQRLFLSMMQSCGICFIYRKGNEPDDTIYIAPDLLPERATDQTQIDARWDASAPQEALTFDYPLLHPGVMRSVIARIGNQAPNGYEKRTTGSASTPPPAASCPPPSKTPNPDPAPNQRRTSIGSSPTPGATTRWRASNARPTSISYAPRPPGAATKSCATKKR